MGGFAQKGEGWHVGDAAEYWGSYPPNRGEVGRIASIYRREDGGVRFQLRGMGGCNQMYGCELSEIARLGTRGEPQDWEPA